VDLILILIVILIVVLLFRGPKMLPKLGEALGRTVKDTRDEFARKSDETLPPGQQPPSS
jgi:TatA/E family protein of Tat protein translocase